MGCGDLSYQRNTSFFQYAVNMLGLKYYIVFGKYDLRSNCKNGITANKQQQFIIFIPFLSYYERVLHRLKGDNIQGIHQQR